jgi:hypothetical protein
MVGFQICRMCHKAQLDVSLFVEFDSLRPRVRRMRIAGSWCALGGSRSADLPSGLGNTASYFGGCVPCHVKLPFLNW